ncbi:unnamed protein product [Notodromas monacha]|uniref:Uncharacterized protein n=1 Tax=Notodromas monacha TaxID=399045 RepID=A0A7R9BNE0_9CRUS|nr:unnamed protein product [Notodromas monacha]CAG0917849.1 unnamed protein product [Notodromas monacha]
MFDIPDDDVTALNQISVASQTGVSELNVFPSWKAFKNDLPPGHPPMTWVAELNHVAEEKAAFRTVSDLKMI